ncbi:FtsX-like permease family protein [Blochmannia endosymbiont of Camponotus sp. C-003]|uniref:FtsX-like permease family protein n=1 Tax=Blochmannia endosymbiont of Camponotus sp. C-003 TaxID=2945588 RepID=UPI0020253FA6|nr:FtsX-like permease family protein [Blochmannia endosymbiont of Camponotus sp. C-003]URJ23425.1 FtsX-like permease family protein [Blochmannia endosymbiont of Camponotus sp. C-003]
MMLSFQIALKFYRGSSSNILLSSMSLISVISITIGIIISIIALSTMNGFEYELNNRILAVIPHGEIEPIIAPFIDWKTALRCIRQIPDIIHATPYINFYGVVEFNNKWNVVYIRSIDLKQNLYDSTLLNFIEKDSWKYFCENIGQIIVGKGISESLGIKAGDWVTVLTTNDFRSNNKLLSSKKIRLQVAGILSLNSQLDYNIAIMSLSDIQHYYDKTSDVSGIAIKINNIFSVNRILYKIKSMLNHQVYVCSWMETYGYIYKDIQMVRIIIYLSMILIIGISCFNVIAALILSIKDKNYDIAIMRALGAKSILIQRVFFLYGLIIYTISGIVGTGVGVFITFNLTNFITTFNGLLGNKILSEGAYFVNFLPVKLSEWDILLILSITLLLGSLTSWYAASKTRRVNLSKILK